MRLLIILVFLLENAAVAAQDFSKARTAYNKMMLAIEKVHTCTFTLSLDERVFDKFLYGRQRVKLQVKPYKVYIYSLKPDEGAEVLYAEGENNNKALINPNRFPYINFNLPLTHSLFRKNHQYTADQVGFTYLHDVLRAYESREKENFYSKLFLNENTAETGSCCYVLEINNNEFGFMNYKVLKNESVTDIARKFHVNDQMILDLNRNIGYFDQVAEGQVITVPNSYAKRIVFYINRKYNLPLKQYIYDHKGLYSKVEFSDFVLNPPIAPAEFKRNYKDYGF